MHSKTKILKKKNPGYKEKLGKDETKHMKAFF